MEGRFLEQMIWGKKKSDPSFAQKQNTHFFSYALLIIIQKLCGKIVIIITEVDTLVLYFRAEPMER